MSESEPAVRLAPASTFRPRPAPGLRGGREDSDHLDRQLRDLVAEATTAVRAGDNLPMVLDGAPANTDLAAAGETLTAEVDAWLHEAGGR